MKLVLVAALVSGAALGCQARPRTIRDLSSPVYEWNQEKAGCGVSYAMDSSGSVWTESGCEGKTTGFALKRRLAPAEREKVAAIFASFPQREPVTCNDSVNNHMFFKKDGDVASVWHVCLPDEGSSVPEPFAAAVRAFGGKP